MTTSQNGGNSFYYFQMQGLKALHHAAHQAAYKIKRNVFKEWL